MRRPALHGVRTPTDRRCQKRTRPRISRFNHAAGPVSPAPSFQQIQALTGPRSRRRLGRARSLHVEHLAQMGAAHQEPRRPAARSLSAWDFRRRFPGGPRRPARQGRAQLFRGCDRAPQERMGGRISTMAEARFVGAPLRLRLGGRRLFAGAHGAAGRMHAGADRRDARGQSFDKLRRS